MTSYELNEVMLVLPRLMLVTVIFLPLTLLIGYFDWAIALPIMAIVLPLFIAPDIRRMVHYVQKWMLTKKVVKVRRALTRSAYVADL